MGGGRPAGEQSGFAAGDGQPSGRAGADREGTGVAVDGLRSGAVGPTRMFRRSGGREALVGWQASLRDPGGSGAMAS